MEQVADDLLDAGQAVLLVRDAGEELGDAILETAHSTLE